MFFKKKSKEIECPNCDSKLEKNFSFCPHCGISLINEENEMSDFGLLGKKDSIVNDINNSMPMNLNSLDKMFNTIFSTLVKSLDTQAKPENNSKLREFPAGIKISIGVPKMQERKIQPKKVKIDITEEQIKRMSSLPRVKAKTSMKRLGDKIIYELSVPGINSPEDVFLVKLESGYEIKAIGEKKVYVNNLPINLPIKKVHLHEDKVFVEFFSQHQNQI